MSPEQGRGIHVDHRADIYAFGLMCYDMLAGRHRVASSSTGLAELMSRMQHSPVALHTVVPAVPDALARVIDTCVEPDPDKRFHTTADLVSALDALDAQGQLRVAPRALPSRLRAGAAAAVVLIVLGIGMAGGWLWSRNRRAPAPAAARAPVSVLIADFHNGTGDPVFQGSLEQALGIAMEGASFIAAYSRADAGRTLASIAGGRPLDEAGAKLVAAREGIKAIVAGAIEPDGSGYVVSVKVVDPRADQTLATRQVRAVSKAAVLGAIGSLASAMRTVLGDTATVTSRAADAESFTTASIEAMRAYARGQELNAAGKPRDALKAFEAAVKQDPGFGRAYVNMASIYTNLKLDDQAKAHYEEALKHLDRMTPREKYRTRGLYYLGIERDYEQAIANFERLVNEYPADNMGYGNLALAYIYVRNIRKAVEVGRKATEVYPANLLQRTNYATYSMYAGDFDTAVEQTGIVLKQNPSYEFAHLTLALSTLARGDLAAAGVAYARLAAVSPLGRSLANMGEADLEIYLGRPRRALEILANGVAVDEKEHSTSNLAVKYVAMAEASLATGDRNGAVAAADAARRSMRRPRPPLSTEPVETVCERFARSAARGSSAFRRGTDRQEVDEPVIVRGGEDVIRVSRRRRGDRLILSLQIQVGLHERRRIVRVDDAADRVHVRAGLKPRVATSVRRLCGQYRGEQKHEGSRHDDALHTLPRFRSENPGADSVGFDLVADPANYVEGGGDYGGVRNMRQGDSGVQQLSLRCGTLSRAKRGCMDGSPPERGLVSSVPMIGDGRARS
jgi:tetratricopeptide (TPR) repeat protein